MSFTIRGTMTVDTLHVTLADGRKLTVLPSGSIYVRAGEHDANEYSLTLPTVEDVARDCDQDPDRPGEVKISVYHRH